MRAALFCFLASLSCLPAAASPLRFIVDTSVSLPYAKFENGELKSGLSFELGVELARHLKREAKFVPVARKRIGQTLESGQADLICGYAQGWLPGPFQWSRPVAQHMELLISRADVPAPQRLSDLAGQSIGSIAGFRYVALELQLGAQFVRDDGPDAEALLRRLAAKRISHAIVSRSYLDYRRREGGFAVALHPPLVIEKMDLRCALSPKAELSLQQLDEGLTEMQTEGSLRVQH
ncbi:substrate-binding periplasmic protein [Roseateles oligotrophus]|uniref:Transporter substrate-binding domain-containing protein n=1 Tax=Roseateles oligotrophus TaxID=1769250 RepID=A0ABT2YIG8_9BURK|nr:transporter substrate-binding domain-containing protein [Roseateles oligotrophus]MCV2369808.1 transporter substrate-binding domain-containing protein [Roseateles oligotrophus]